MRHSPPCISSLSPSLSLSSKRSRLTNLLSSRRANHKSSDGAPPTRKTAVKGQKVLTGRVTKGRDPAKSHGKIPRDVKVEVGDDGPDAAEGSERMEETDDDDEEVEVEVVEEEDGAAVVKKEEEV